jgi:hypothetical protein
VNEGKKFTIGVAYCCGGVEELVGVVGELQQRVYAT